MASQSSRLHRFAHYGTVFEGSSGDRRVGVERQRPKSIMRGHVNDSSHFFEMVPTALAKKRTGSKPNSKPAEKKKPPPPESVDASSSGDEGGWEGETSGDESEDDGVDEVGFEKLIKALGDDGLNDYDQAHLVALTGDEEEDEESEEGEDAEEDEGLEEVSGSEEEDEEIPEKGDKAEEGGSGSEGAGVEEDEPSGDEDVLALDELEDVELHPDAVPRRGVKVIDNKVRATRI